MNDFKIVFIIDKIEFKYFEFNKLVTSFWLIKECKQRNWDVFITTSDKLYLNGNIPYAMAHEVKLKGFGDSADIIYQKESFSMNLNETDMVIFRPDPPVDMDYIFSTYILDYVDQSKTIVINNSSGIRKANEKLYINNFPSVIPENITTSSACLIKDFLENHGEVIVKPLNRCFGKGVFYLKNGDKNTNSILEMLTNGGNTVVMAQKYLEGAINGDKRVLIMGGEILDESVIKISGKGDFKFNTHNDEYLKKGNITDEEREMVRIMAPKLLEDGLFLVGLDVIDNKVIEINVTSPCFFIKEINQMFGVELEKKMVNYLENLLHAQKGDRLLTMV
jgi:glutathione synthase